MFQSKLGAVCILVACLATVVSSQQCTNGRQDHGTSCLRPDVCCSGLCRDVGIGRACYCRDAPKRCSSGNDCCSYNCVNGRCTIAGGPSPNPPPVSFPTPPPPPTNPGACSLFSAGTVCRRQADCCSLLCKRQGDVSRCHCKHISQRCRSDRQCCSGSCNGVCISGNPLPPSPTPPPTPPPTPRPTFFNQPTPPPSPPVPQPTPPPTPPPSAIPGGCQDTPVFAPFCANYQASGFCAETNNVFLSFMQDNCARTCNFNNCANGGGGNTPTLPPPTPRPTFGTNPTQPPQPTPRPTQRPTTPPPTPPPTGGNCRVRRSWHDMSSGDQNRFTTAWNRLATGAAGSSLQSQFRALIDMHLTNFNSGIHGPRLFLPWHRWYLMRIENLLRQVDGTVTIPYWPWEADGGLNSNIWTSDGIGSVRLSDRCVVNGPFSQYDVTPFTMSLMSTSSRSALASNNPCLNRGGRGTLPGTQAVLAALSTGANNFFTFNDLLDGMHGAVHCGIGGTMCEDVRYQGRTVFTAANAPEFFLHHANVDRIWETFQQQSSAHRTSFINGASGSTMAGTGFSVSDMFFNTRLMGTCVEYPGEQLRMSDRDEPEECPLTWLQSMKQFFPEQERWIVVRDIMNEALCNSNSPRLPPLNMTTRH